MTRSERALGILLFASVSLVACSASGPTAASPVAGPGSELAAALQTLRVSNAGSRSIEGLVVMFPEERVEFGDLAAGVTTTYRPFSKGVFRYAAYQHRIEGSMVTQPVIDWVGERPMPGQAFTYVVEVVEDSTRRANIQIRLVSTTRDQ
jgi:hypothetical protein